MRAARPDARTTSSTSRRSTAARCAGTSRAATTVASDSAARCARRTSASRASTDFDYYAASASASPRIRDRAARRCSRDAARPTARAIAAYGAAAKGSTLAQLRRHRHRPRRLRRRPQRAQARAATCPARTCRSGRSRRCSRSSPTTCCCWRGTSRRGRSSSRRSTGAAAAGSSSRCPSRERSCRPDRRACPACGAAAGLEVFYERAGVPVHSCRLSETREEALAFPRGDARLAFCGALRLHHEHRLRPGPAGLLASRTRRRRASRRASGRSCERLARALVERYDLRGKDVLEIGCGKGEFLVAALRARRRTAGSGSTRRSSPERLDARPPGA